MGFVNITLVQQLVLLLRNDWGWDNLHTNLRQFLTTLLLLSYLIIIPPSVRSLYEKHLHANDLHSDILVYIVLMYSRLNLYFLSYCLLVLPYCLYTRVSKCLSSVCKYVDIFIKSGDRKEDKQHDDFYRMDISKFVWINVIYACIDICVCLFLFG